VIYAVLIVKSASLIIKWKTKNTTLFEQFQYKMIEHNNSMFFFVSKRRMDVCTLICFYLYKKSLKISKR